MKQRDAESIFLNETDIDHIARVVETEVGANWQGDVLKTGVAAIVDTILNRVAYGPFPETVTDVVNRQNAFTKINGPKSHHNSKLKRRVELNPYGRVQNAPKAGGEIDRLVRETIAERASGQVSIVGPSLHYANPHPAYSGDNARGPDGWVWQIAQDPYLVTGTGKYHSHVHGTDLSMRPLAAAPAIKFAPSSEIDKPSIDDLHHVFKAPDGLDMVAPPIPAEKGVRAPQNPMRAKLIDHTERKPLSFNDYRDRTESKLEFQKNLAGGRENHVGPRDQSIYDVALLDLNSETEPSIAAEGVERAPAPSRKPLPSGVNGSRSKNAKNGSGGIRIPTPRMKPDQRASEIPREANPFNFEKTNLKLQAEMIERNPVMAKRMVLAEKRDPKLFCLA
ncbi:cell wall hydrolase [Roseibium sp. SCPC15]|uniref:cell wall hydrolase n=1 Tax=Roseibium sp. SCP15 TaxID=3141376 RepID=UPI0033369A43